MTRARFSSGAPYPDDGRPFGDGLFDTANGRVDLASDTLAGLGHPRVPLFVAPRESHLGDPALTSRFPLQLLTPKHHTRFLNSAYSQLPKHGPLEGAPFLELHPTDASARGLAAGDPARRPSGCHSPLLEVRTSPR